MNPKTKRATKLLNGSKYVTKDFKRNKKTIYAGVHLLAEFWGGKNIEDEKEIKKILITAAKKAKSTPLKISIHKFNPQGMTGIILLAESHIALHAWPELDYLAIDIFTCGEKSEPEKALEYLKEKFQPKKVEIKNMKRGILSENYENFKKNL